MAIDLVTVPVPMFQQPVRSAIQLARRMLLIRWSTGKYLTANAGNYGVKRPALGFSDDEFFRAIAMVLMADYKAIGNAFWQLLEISLGPWIDPAAPNQFLDFEIELDASAGKSFFVLIEEDADRLPYFGTGVIDPGGANEEEVDFTTVDRYLNRVRTRNPLTKNHISGEVLRVNGGCWEFIEAKARRIAIRIRCAELFPQRLPGNSYIGEDAFLHVSTRIVVTAGDTIIPYDDSLLDGSFVQSGPLVIIIDPEDIFGGAFQVTASAINQLTREITIPALPAGAYYRARTKIRLIGVRRGTLDANALISDTTIKAVLRVKDPVGNWWLDAGGANEELVFVKSTTYQKRQTANSVKATDTTVWIDTPFDGIAQGVLASSLKVLLSDSTGVLGVVDVTSVTWYGTTGSFVDPRKLAPQLHLSAAAGFAAPDGVTAELVDNAAAQITLTLGRPIAIAHTAGELLTKAIGTSAVVPTYAAHTPVAHWPQVGDPPTPRWPGPYVYDPTRRQPHGVKEMSTSSVLAIASVSQSQPSDARIYLVSEQVANRYDPLVATDWPFATPLLVGGVQYKPKVMKISSNELLPTTDQINKSTPIKGWRFNPSNPNPGLPIRLVVGGEGGFGRPEVFYWGKSTTNTTEIYVSGVLRIHQPGTRVASFVEQLPIEATVGVLGVDAGLPVTKKTILLDYSTVAEEQVIYDTLMLETPTRALLTFERGFTPLFSHDPFRADRLDSSDVFGVSVIRADDLSIPLANGYSFSFLLGGGSSLSKLSFVLDLVRAAGVKVDLYDEKDKLIVL